MHAERHAAAERSLTVAARMRQRICRQLPSYDREGVVFPRVAKGDGVRFSDA